MQLKNEHHTFTGMQRDNSISRQPTSFLYDARNIRLTAREGDTLYTITNEKGTSETDISIEGIYLGHCLLNQYLVVFSTDTTVPNVDNIDYITRIDLSSLTKKVLYFGSSSNNEDLNFSVSHPIEAIPSYETEEIQKVYWTDGLNQPRMINIIGKGNPERFDYNSKSFDFVRELALGETVTVKKLVGASGMFAPGVIQYAFTYYTKYGQETNIFYTTPLYYISPKDRGAAPDEKVDNAFKITVTGVDRNFDYLRIYSIQRTSINGTPICKRIQDIAIDGLSTVPSTDLLQASYTDTGFSGNSIDPAELLYKGGEEITVGTIEQKDGTLFLGDIKIFSNMREAELNSIVRGNVAADARASEVTIDSDTRSIVPSLVSDGDYRYANQLTSNPYTSQLSIDSSKHVPCGGFMPGQWYRLGVQFQYKTGKWSKPVFVQDYKLSVGSSFTEADNIITLPIIKGTLSSTASQTLIDRDYKKARAVIVFPTLHDRDVICSGVTCPTLFTDNHREWRDISVQPNQMVGNNDLYAQPSWFFRFYGNAAVDSNGAVFPEGIGIGATGEIPYTNPSDPSNPTVGDPTDPSLRSVEIQGIYNIHNQFKIDSSFVTFHSPDIEFDTQLHSLNYQNVNILQVGIAEVTNTFSSIDLQTETPTISNIGSGFIHKSFNTDKYGIVSGLFYDDCVVEDWNSWGGESMAITDLKAEKSSAKWMVYLWNKAGSLNNDISRPVNKGVSSAVLKKKVISNLRYTVPSPLTSSISLSAAPQLFSSNELSILKFNWNEEVDQHIQSKQGLYQGNIDTMIVPDSSDGQYFAFNGSTITSPNINTPFTSDWWWKTWADSDQEPTSRGLFYWDIINGWTQNLFSSEEQNIGNQYLSLVLKKEAVRMRYKSTPHLAFKVANDFSNNNEPTIPIVKVTQTVTGRYGGYSSDAFQENTWVPCGEPVALNSEDGTEFFWEYGDTYFQRYDCLKTYAFSPEDENQVVEIGSFMLETHMNIDGRYDRNRGQMNNTNMSPMNFNLMNPVYSQIDNFFSYRILPDDFYSNTQFPNQITWTKEKTSGASVDQWTNITLGSTYDMDGSKGKVVSLNTWKDRIFCFQKKGISNILFNSRVQIPASDGVPIEITNSYKVDGYRYISDGIGCNKSELICATPEGLYFIDSVGGHLFHIGSDLSDVTATHGMNSWFDNNNIDKILYDDVNHDVYLVSKDYALCFSELLGQFTSFMDYGGISLIETYNRHVVTFKDSDMYKLFEGQYNNFFGSEETPKFKPWYFTFISNGVDNSLMDFDKIFTNIDYRMDMKDDESYQHDSSLDYIRVVNEYQDTGVCDLKMFTKVNDRPMKYPLKDKNLQKKFREWRIQIPRSAGTVDRIRNPWCKITLGSRNENNYQAVLHDLNVQYYL